MTTRHTFTIMASDQPTKRRRVGDGVSLILTDDKGKLKAQSYEFNPEKYTFEEAQSWIDKAGVDYIKKINANLSLKAWDGSASNYTLEQWKNACVMKVCDKDVKDCYKLPVKTPDGTLDEGGVKAAWGVLNGSMGGVKASPELIAQAKKTVDGYYSKLGIKHTVNAARPDGMIWSKGIHHVYVNDKPARIKVPQETIMQTFQSIRDIINRDGRMSIGIDHLSDDILLQNEILAKMNLLDVGDVTKVGTDGDSIFLLDSELTNDNIQELYDKGEINAYSIVGGIDAKPCPTGEVDYVVENVNVERVDFVNEGGCQICKTGVQPNELILTSKNANMEDKSMTENEVNPTETVEEPQEVVTNETEQVDETEVETSENVEENEVIVEPETPATPEGFDPEKFKESIIDGVVEKLGGKKPKEVKASDSTEFDVKTEVDALIMSGKAVPKQREALTIMAKATSPEAFKEMVEKMPKIVSMETRAKFAKVEEQSKPKKSKPKTWDEEYGELAKHFRIK